MPALPALQLHTSFARHRIYLQEEFLWDVRLTINGSKSSWDGASEGASRNFFRIRLRAACSDKK
jgi:hypothetical protein